MNKSLIDVSGELMIVSQFTLHAQTKKGNRPSYVDAANGDIAEKIYKSFILEIENKYNLKPKTGKFGADMKVELENDCLLYTSPSPRDLAVSRMPSSA